MLFLVIFNSHFLSSFIFVFSTNLFQSFKSILLLFLVLHLTLVFFKEIILRLLFSSTLSYIFFSLLFVFITIRRSKFKEVWLLQTVAEGERHSSIPSLTPMLLLHLPPWISHRIFDPQLNLSPWIWGYLRVNSFHGLKLITYTALLKFASTICYHLTLFSPYLRNPKS